VQNDIKGVEESNQSLNQSLLTADNHITQFVTDYIHEVNRVSKFFKQTIANIKVELEILRSKFDGRLKFRD
jgi:hypothetical protein